MPGIRNKHTAGVALAVVLLGGARLAPAQGGAVGQFINTTGTVTVQKASGATVKGALLVPVENADVIRVADGGRAEVVLFSNGARFALPAGSVAAVSSSGVTARGGAAPEARKGVTVAAAATRRGNERILGLVVRNGRFGVRDLTPNGATLEDQVVLKWGGIIDAARLELRITNLTQDVYRVQLPVSAREHRVPAGILRPGVDYGWILSGLGPDGDIVTTNVAWLRVANAAERKLIERLRQDVAEIRREDPDSPVGSALLGLGLERLGYWREARTAFEAAQKLRPDDEGLKTAIENLNNILGDSGR